MVAISNTHSDLPLIDGPGSKDASTALYLFQKLEKSVEIIEKLNAQNNSLLVTNLQLESRVRELEAEVDRLR